MNLKSEHLAKYCQHELLRVKKNHFKYIFSFYCYSAITNSNILALCKIHVETNHLEHFIIILTDVTKNLL